MQDILQLLEIAVDAGPHGVVVVDATLPDRPIVFVNRRFENITGYLAEEVLGRNCSFIRGPEEEDADLDGLRAAIKEEREWVGLLRNYRKDGTQFRSELHVVPIRDAHGRLINFVGVFSDVTEQVEARAQLREAEERYRTLVETIPATTYTQKPNEDHNFASLYLSPQVEQTLGYSPAEFSSNPELWVSLLHPEDRDRVLAKDARTEKTGEPFQIEYRMVRKDGQAVWIRDEAVLVHDSEGRPRFWQGVMMDVTERKNAEERVRQTEERYRTLVETIPAVAYVWQPRPDPEFAYINPRIEDLTGYPPEAFYACPDLWDSIIHPEDLARVLAEDHRTDTTGDRFAMEYRIFHRDGHAVWVRDDAILVDGSTQDHLVWQGVITDVTERKVLEDRLSHQAMHDPLTGLPNRVLLSDRLMHALSRAGRQGNEVAVLFLDLDNFKYVNDSLGHGAGDQLLGGVARRLGRVIRPQDTLARLGGDEFVVLLEDVEARAEACRVATRIQDALRTPITVDDREFFLTTSVGIAFGGNAGNHPEDLLRDADAAMYRAKQAGKDQHALFSPEMQERSIKRLGLEGDLRRALKAPEKELRVFYQPKALIETGDIVGVEALVRWDHPERGLILPAEFIPLAEETGMIVPLGRWVLVEACRQARQWQLEHPTDAPLFVNVNLSACQFRDSRLASDVRDALAGADLDPQSLILEITESTLMEDAASTLETLRWLKDLGVRLAIDDFGTGYSSLAYLKRFPVDSIKIDRSIISGLERDSGNAAIVSATITLAHALGLEAVAEGVEAEEELTELRRLGCDLGQGYYFYKPAPAEKTSALLAAELRRPQSRIRHR